MKTTIPQDSYIS